jgi:hypothetical protein
VHQQTREAYFGLPKIRIPLTTDISFNVDFSSLHTSTGADAFVFFTTPKSLYLGSMKTPAQWHQPLLGLKKVT